MKRPYTRADRMRLDAYHMKQHQTIDPDKASFIELLLDSNVLLFGDFVTKAGHKTPYFLNFGNISTGRALARLGKAYADKIMDWGIEFDMVFGAAYKGIPIATATAAALAEHHGRSVSVGFNRKEAKGHGEGGDSLGAPLAGRVVLLDDVTSAGTTAIEMQGRTRRFGATFVGMLIGVDRQDPVAGTGESSLEAISRKIEVPIKSIVTRSDIQAFLDARVEWREQAEQLRSAKID